MKSGSAVNSFLLVVGFGAVILQGKRKTKNVFSTKKRVTPALGQVIMLLESKALPVVARSPRFEWFAQRVNGRRLIDLESHPRVNVVSTNLILTIRQTLRALWA